MNCSVNGCEREAKARGWCMKHYNRWHRNGTLEKRPVGRPRGVELTPRGLDGIPHGTANGYGNYHCRCTACREAMRVYHRVYLEIRGRRLGECSFEDCRRWQYAKGYCKSHYNQLRIGQPLSRFSRQSAHRSGELWCGYCEQWKSDAEFSRDASRFYRRGRRSPCRECDAEARALYRLRHRATCAECGQPCTERKKWDAKPPRCHRCAETRPGPRRYAGREA